MEKTCRDCQHSMYDGIWGEWKCKIKQMWVRNVYKECAECDFYNFVNKELLADEQKTAKGKVYDDYEGF